MQRRQIEKLLPEVFQRTVPESPLLSALLEVMEKMHAPVDERLDDLDRIFDPRRCPDAFVPLLARWVGLDIKLSTGLGRKRELVARAAELSQWRGTGRGMRDLLSAATGLGGFKVEENRDQDGRPRPFHLLVTAPAESAPHREMLEDLIAAEKPAYVTHQLRFEP